MTNTENTNPAGRRGTADRRAVRSIARLEALQAAAAQRGDTAAAAGPQEALDDLRDAIRCSDCGAILGLEMLPSGGSYVPVWVDFSGGMHHFNPAGGVPLLVQHRVEVPA